MIDLGDNALGGQLPGGFLSNGALREVGLAGNAWEGALPAYGFVG